MKKFMLLIFIAGCAPVSQQEAIQTAAIVDAALEEGVASCCDCLVENECVFFKVGPFGSDTCEAALDGDRLSPNPICLAGSPSSLPRGLCTKECKDFSNLLQ